MELGRCDGMDCSTYRLVMLWLEEDVVVGRSTSSLPY